MKRTTYLCALMCLLVAALSAQNDKTPEKTPYGMKAGTVMGSAGFGGMHFSGSNGLHPAIVGGAEIGLHKYMAVFVDGGYSHAGNSASACVYSYCVSAGLSEHFYSVGGGLEVVGTNRSRFVPYGRIGAAYASVAQRARVSGLVGGSYGDTYSAPAVVAGGGLKTYITHRIGIDTKLTVLRTVGNNGGGTAIAPTVGVFFQTK